MPASTRLSLVTFVPAWAAPPPTRNPGGAPEPRVADLVTVTSVPTPYRECRTVPCASLTPADAAVTVITRPIPTAIPKARVCQVFGVTDLVGSSSGLRTGGRRR